jgi:hypothetical protein
MEESILRRLIKGRFFSQTVTDRTDPTTKPEAQADLVAVDEDNASPEEPDKYGPEFSWGPIASEPARPELGVDERR